MQSVLWVVMAAFTFGVASCGGDNEKKSSGKDDDLSSMIPDAKDVESAVNDIFEEAKPLVDSVAKGFGGAVSDEDYEKTKEAAKETAGKISKEAIDSAAGQINIIKEEAAKKLDEAKEQLGLSDKEKEDNSAKADAEKETKTEPAEPEQKAEKKEEPKPEVRAQEPEKPSTERTTVAKVPPAPKTSAKPEYEPRQAPVQRTEPRPLPERRNSETAQQDEEIEGDVVLQSPEEGPTASRCRCPRKNGADESTCNCSEAQNGCTCGTGYCEGCDCNGTMAGNDKNAESEGPSALAIIGIVLLALLLIAVITLIVVLTRKNKTDAQNTPPYGPNNGYNQPYNGYSQPGNNYGNPNNGYQQPYNGYQQPGAGYQQPGNGYGQSNKYYEDRANPYDSPQGSTDEQQPPSTPEE